MRVQDRVEDVDRAVGFGGEVGTREPALAGLGQGTCGDQRCARRRHRGGLGGGGGGAGAAPPGEQAPLRRTQRAQHEDVGGLAGVPAQHVAPVGRPEGPRDLELDEPEERRGVRD